MISRLAPVAVLLALLAGCRSTSPVSRINQADREIFVAAAADLKYALDEIAREFGNRNKGIRVNAAYGSSGNFYSQLQNHAPFDIFLSADVEYPRKLAQQGLCQPESEFVYGVGRIVVWVPADSAINVEKLGINALSHPSVTHIAIANPLHAPYGRAAEAALRSLGVYGTVQAKLVFGDNVAQTLQFVQSGNAEIGIVAMSLAVTPALRNLGRYWVVPLDKYPRLEQGGVILKGAKNAGAASQFRAFLTSPEGRAIFKQYGFYLPGE